MKTEKGCLRTRISWPEMEVTARLRRATAAAGGGRRELEPYAGESPVRVFDRESSEVTNMGADPGSNMFSLFSVFIIWVFHFLFSVFSLEKSKSCYIFKIKLTTTIY